ncbi:MAG: DUF6850 family outer membrane beta-barrel protein [Mangrovibacterium sp.]
MTNLFHKLSVLIVASLLNSASFAQVFCTNVKNELSESAWLNSANPAGLYSFSKGKASLAEVYALKTKGDFVNYYESNNSLSLGVHTESIVRLNSKLVLSGEVNYANFSGENMGGATFINPDYNPFNIVEYNCDDAGTKKSESYAFEGGLSLALHEKWLMGANIYYQTMGYYKTKDLRHTNDWLELKTDFGILRQLGKSSLGASYHYQRTVESISFQMVGTTDREFNLLIDYGLFFGRQERFGGASGYTVKSTPMVNDFHGGALQFGTRFKSLDFYSEAGINFRRGYYGTKASSTVIYTDHEGNEMFYKAVFTLRQTRAVHRLHVLLQQNDLNNKANSYREETASNGNTTVAYYGANQVGKKANTQLAAQYRGQLESWEFQADGALNQKKETATSYPEYRKQELQLFSASLAAQRHFSKDKNRYSPYLQVQCGGGNGDEYAEGKYGSGESETKTVRLDDYLQREYEFLTASRTSVLLGFKYTHRLAHAQTLGFDIAYQHTKAADVFHIGSNSGALSVRLTYGF